MPRILPFFSICARVVAILWVAGIASSTTAATLQARGVESGLTTPSPTISIADAAPIGDPLEFRLFYAANASGGTTMDYDGLDPILESDLVADAAHLFVLEKSGDLALFVVYKRQAGTQSADATFSATAGAFALGDILVRDADLDDYSIVSGDIETSHRITVGGRTDGYVAALSGRFDGPGDVLNFAFRTPAATTSDLPFTSIQVYAGLDGGGDPIWFEIDSGPYSSSTSRTVELTFAPVVPALGPVSSAVLLLMLASLGGAILLRARATA